MKLRKHAGEPGSAPDYDRIRQLERGLGIRTQQDIDAEIAQREEAVHDAIRERHERARDRLMQASGTDGFLAAKALFLESYDEYQADLRGRYGCPKV